MDSNPQPLSSYTNTQPFSHLTGQGTIQPNWPNWLIVWVFVYELSGCGCESSCSHLNFRFHACFEQGVPCHSGNYRVWIHTSVFQDLTQEIYKQEKTCLGFKWKPSLVINLAKHLFNFRNLKTLRKWLIFQKIWRAVWGCCSFWEKKNKICWHVVGTK